MQCGVHHSWKCTSLPVVKSSNGKALLFVLNTFATIAAHKTAIKTQNNWAEAEARRDCFQAQRPRVSLWPKQELAQDEKSTRPSRPRQDLLMQFVWRRYELRPHIGEKGRASAVGQTTIAYSKQKVACYDFARSAQAVPAASSQS